METRTRNAKNKKKGTKSNSRRRTTLKQRYVFVPSVVSTPIYQDYFNPVPEVEKRVLSLADLASAFLPVV